MPESGKPGGPPPAIGEDPRRHINSGFSSIGDRQGKSVAKPLLVKHARLVALKLILGPKNRAWLNISEHLRNLRCVAPKFGTRHFRSRIFWETAQCPDVNPRSRSRCPRRCVNLSSVRRGSPIARWLGLFVMFSRRPPAKPSPRSRRHDHRHPRRFHTRPGAARPPAPMRI